MKCGWFILLFTLCSFWVTSAWSVELKNDILTFESKDEAVSYSFRSFWDYVPEGSALEAYGKADAIVEKLWPHFCELYPNCKDFPKPEILLSYAAGSGSFGAAHDGVLRQTNAIILSWELNDQPRDLEFVIAHEMIHYFEKHATKNDLKDEIFSIRRQTAAGCIDYPYPLEEVKDNLLDIIKAMEHIGDRPHLVAPELAIPLEGDLGLVLERMIEKTAHYPGCKTLQQQMSHFRSHVKAGNYIYETNDEVKSFMELSKKCFEKYPGNLLKEATKTLKLQLEGPHPSYWSEYESIVSTDGPEFDRLRHLRTNRYQNYLELSRKLVGPQLRFHTEEDEADIKALNILLKSGRRNLREGIDYLLVDLPVNEQIRCRRLLSEGKEPNYGPLNRFHHGECWRVWRAMKVEKRYLEKYPD